MAVALTLSEKLRGAAASVGTRGGRKVPLHYGSAAGELALCARAVGAVDREDLTVWEVRGPAGSIDAITAERFSGGLRRGEAATLDRCHWARIEADQLLVVTPGAGGAKSAASRQPVSGGDPIAVGKARLAPLGIVGPGTTALLADLGADCLLERPAGEGRVATTVLGSSAVVWLLLDDSFALALVDPLASLAAWEAISTAGRRFGLGYVGAEAAERFEASRCWTPRREPASV